MRHLLAILFLCATAQAQYLTNPFRFASGSTLNQSLVCYWDLDEASGTRADSEPNGTPRNLTDVNTVTSDTGKIGNAAVFVAASNERLTSTDNADLSAGDSHFSGRIWVNLGTDGADRYIISKYASVSNQRELIVRYNNSLDRFQFGVYPDGTDGSLVTVTANNFGAVSTGTWYCIHFGHNPESNLIWIAVNGTLNTQSHSTGCIDGTADFEIGTRAGVSGWDGLLDEAALWRKTLTTDEITEDVNGGSGTTCCPMTPE